MHFPFSSSRTINLPSFNIFITGRQLRFITVSQPFSSRQHIHYSDLGSLSCDYGISWSVLCWSYHWCGRLRCLMCTAVVFRPGVCAGSSSGEKFKVSNEFPDETLNFIKLHPLMDEAVPSIANRPWFLKTMVRWVESDVNYAWRSLSCKHGLVHISAAHFNGWIESFACDSDTKPERFVRYFMNHYIISARPWRKDDVSF